MPCPELAVTAGSSFRWGCSAGRTTVFPAGQGRDAPVPAGHWHAGITLQQLLSSALLPGTKLLSCCMAGSPAEPAWRGQAGQHLGSTGLIISACSCHGSCVLGGYVCVWGGLAQPLACQGLQHWQLGRKLIKCNVAPWRRKHGETINTAFHNAILWCHSSEFIKT